MVTNADNTESNIKSETQTLRRESSERQAYY